MAKKFKMPDNVTKGYTSIQGTSSLTQPSNMTVSSPNKLQMAEELQKAAVDAKAATNAKKENKFVDRMNYAVSHLPEMLAMNPATNMSTNFTMTALRMFADAGEFLSEPWEGLPLGDEINWLRVTELLDQINPTGHSILESQGYTAPTPVLEQTGKKIGLALEAIFDKEMTSEQYHDEIATLNEKRQYELNKLREEEQERPWKTTIPFLGEVTDRWNNLRDGKPSMPQTHLFHTISDFATDVKDYIGPTQLPFSLKNSEGEERAIIPAAEYIINGSNELVASIGASVVMGMGGAGAFTKLGKLGAIARRPMLQKAVKGIGTNVIAATQTGGESMQVAKSASERYMNEAIRKAGGEKYQKELNDYIKLQLSWTAAQNEGIMSRVAEANVIKNATDAFNQRWKSENETVMKEIRKNAFNVFETAAKTNAVNIFMNRFASGLFFKGKFPSRGIKKRPTRGRNLFGSDARIAGGYEAAEEVVNTIAEEAGIARGHGEGYGAIGTIETIFSKEGLEAGMWGYLGGHGEAAMTNFTTHRARLEEFEAQQEVIKRQNNIGDATADMVDKVMSTDQSLRGMVKDSNLLQVLQAQGKEAEAELLSDRMLVNQTENALRTGTVENLIDNYEKVAANETLTDEIRQSARDAVNRIGQFETLYNRSFKYRNNDDVYYNRANQLLVSEALKINESELIDLQNKMLIKNAENDTLVEGTSETDSKAIADKQSFVNELKDTYKKLKNEESYLTSRKAQRSTRMRKNFHQELQESVVELRKDFKAKNPDKQFNLYESPEFQKVFDALTEKYKSSITDVDMKGIINNHQNNIKTYKEWKKEFESNIIKKAASVQEEIAAQTIKTASSEKEADAEKNISDMNELIDDEDVFEWGGEPSKDPTIIPDDDTTPEVREMLSRTASSIYNALTDSTENPTIEDGVRYYMGKTSYQRTERDLDALVKGWKYAKLPGYENLNTQQLFEKMFMNVDSAIQELQNFVDSMPQAIQTEEQSKEIGKKFDEKTDNSIQKENTGKTTLDMNGEEVVPEIEFTEETGKDKLNTTSATLAHKSTVAIKTVEQDGETVEISYDDSSDELNIGQYAPNQVKLLFPSKYNQGTELTVEIADDYLNKRISLYNDDGSPVLQKENGKIVYNEKGKAKIVSMKFSEWMEQNNIEEGSQEFIDAIPMVVKDSDGDIVSLIHNIKRISPYHNTDDTVIEAKKKTRKIRNAAYNGGSAKIKITDRWNMGRKFGYYEENVPLSQADPTSTLVMSRGNEIAYDKEGLGIVDESKQIVQFDGMFGDDASGELFELRRAGFTKDGLPKYFALHAKRPTGLDSEVEQSIGEVVELYLNRKNNPEVYRNFAARVYNETNGKIDLRTTNPNNAHALDMYLNQFVFMTTPSQSTGTTDEKINKTISDLVKRKGVNRTPSNVMFTISNKVVTATIYGGDLAQSKKSIQQADADTDNAVFMENLKSQVLPKMRVNSSLSFMNSPEPVMLLIDGKIKRRSKNYNDYLRSTFKTNFIAKKVTANFNGNDESAYVSFQQPTIEVDLVEDTEVTQGEYAEAIEKQEVSNEVADKIAQKIFEGDKLNSDEERVRIINPEKIEAALRSKQKQELTINEGKKVTVGDVEMTPDQIKALINQKQDETAYLDKYKRHDRKSRDPRVLEGDEEQELIESQRTIRGLFQSDERNIVEYIFAQVSSVVRVDNGKVTNIQEVRDTIRNLFEGYLKSREQSAQTNYERFRSIAETGQYDGVTELVDNYKRELDLIKSVRDNYEVFEEQAINMSKKFFEIDGAKNNSNDPDADEEQTEEKYDVEDDKTKDWSKTAEEINHKERVSKEIRVFCQGIKQKDASGNEVLGIFGIPTYVGFDTVFDTVSQILADVPSDTKLYKEVLNAHKDSYDWMSDFYEKLFPKDESQENESLQNQFVRHMNKHALDMEFVMFKRNNNDTFSLRIYNANSAAIIQNIKTTWRNNTKNSPLIRPNAERNYVFSLKGINDVLDQYESLKSGEPVDVVPTYLAKEIRSAANDFTKRMSKELEVSLSTEQLFKNLLNHGGVESIPVKGETLTALANVISEMGKGVKPLLDIYGGKFEIQREANNRLSIKRYQEPKPRKEELLSFLNNFGIEISDKTAEDILYRSFIYDKNTKVKFSNQWQGEDNAKGTSLLGVLAGTLKQIRSEIHPTSRQAEQWLKENPYFTEDSDEYKQFLRSNQNEVNYDEEGADGQKLLNQTIIDALAKMESRHTEQRVVSSFYDNKKVIYGYTVTKYITDRVRDLKRNRHNILDDLSSTSFNSHSFWLDMFKQDSKFNHKFLVKHLNINALKERGKKLYRDNGIQELSKIDHELTKLGFFMDMFQDKIDIESQSGKLKYRGLNFRTSRMFSPTMSDKSTVTMIKTAVVDITSDNLNEPKFKDILLDFAYSQLVSPELERIFNHTNEIKSTNVKDYDKGAKLFYFIPRLNNLTVKLPDGEVSIQSLIENKNSVADIENMKVVRNGQLVTLKSIIKDEVSAYMDELQSQKLNQWEESKFIRMGDDGYEGYSFLDEKYMNSRSKSGTIDERLRVAAYDYVFNSMVANANSFMMIAGDPAQFYSKKPTTKEDDSIQIVEDTYENIGKRLANQIAPGDKIADADVRSNTFRQLMLKDSLGVSDNIKMIVKVNDEKDITENEVEEIRQAIANKDAIKIDEAKEKYPNSWDYFKIESTDAQEYSTWREHLYVLEKMGKSPNYTLDVTQDDIDRAREIFTKEITWDTLTDKQKSIVRRVVQPIKPVYTGQIKDGKSDLMRTVYIKSSSFPLIPQLTAGFEIDKLRTAMEKLEKHSNENGTGNTVRASYMTANKVGGINNPVQSFDNIDKLPVEKLMLQSLELPRSGFRIQQNVPYKSGLTEEDVTTLGTQTVKLLFGNGVIDMIGFNYHGEKSGSKLYNEYFNHFNQLVNDARENLYEQLGIDPVTHKVRGNRQAFLSRISKILKNEAILRGYPRQDIEALGINPETQDFVIPVWMSPNAAKYEALLTAIISHRIAKIKFPGYAYVIGSENGFRVKTDEQFDVDKNGSHMVFTNAWDGVSLKPNQAFVQSKFRVDGKLINLIEDVDSNGNKKWIKKVDGKWILDTNKINPELLSIPSFRIPTSKHSTMEQIEIAGFLPSNSADLMIVSKDGIVKMGEDYDVDKRYTYNLWTAYENDKLIPIDKKIEYQVKGKKPIDVLEDELVKTKREVAQLKGASRRISNLTAQQLELIDEIEVLTGFGMETDEQEKTVEKLARRIEKLTEQDINNEIGTLRDKLNTLKNDKKKIIQNEIIRIHSAVMKHPKVNELMVQKLSIDDARAEAMFMEGIQKKRNDYFTGLSDMYQQDKLMSGIVGKDGTAAYSLDVVGQSLFEQADKTGKTLTVMRPSDTGLKPMKLRFGNVVSDGKLGQEKTLAPSTAGTVNRSGKRSIAEVHSERQNLMVDNEKEQIAPRVHLNSYTMRVDKMLNMLGFDKGEDGHIISFLFISQPIVKEYVRRMEAENSNTVEYDPERKKKIVDELLGEFINDETEEQIWDTRMTNDKFIEEIKNNGQDKAFQAAVLRKFTMLEEFGDNLTSVQTALNIDSKGVGKNLFEVTEKINAIQKLFLTTDEELKETGLIDNAGALIGDYQLAYNTKDRDLLLEKGYIQVKNQFNDERGVGSIFHMIKPTTVAGSYAINSLVAADRLWGNFFPYNMSGVTDTFDEIIGTDKIQGLIGNSDLSEQKTIETKRRIFNEMKKYLVTEQELGYFTMTPQQERRRLFFDGVKGTGSSKQSLATFLKGVLSNNDYRELRKNRLLNRLTFDINTNGNPSFIKLDNAIGQNFDETYIYDSLIGLVDLDIEIGKFGENDNYTTLNLAQDLALYAYMEGGVQQAIQFVKYIPVSYLKVMGIDRIMHHPLKSGKEKNFQGRNVLGMNKSGISTFSYQFMQHNPELAKRVGPEIMEDNELFETVERTDDSTNGIIKFRYTGTDSRGRHPQFVSIYNRELPKGENRFQLYVFTPTTDGGMYVRVPVYGTFGMSEYSAKKRGYRSLVNQKKTTFPLHDEPVSPSVEPQAGSTAKRFNIKNGSVKESLELIARNEDTPIGKIAQFLLPVMNPETSMTVKQIGSRGEYHGLTNEIIMSSDIINNHNITDSEVATTFVREVVHSITDGILSKYVEQGINSDEEFRITETKPEGVTDAEFKAVKKLFSVFNQARKHLNKNDKLNTLLKKNLDREGLTPEEYNVTYGGYNIKEFVERMLTSPELQQEMNKVEYGNSGESIGQKFWEWLSSTLKDIAVELGITNINENSITANAFESIFTIIQESSVTDNDTDSKARKTIAKGENTLTDLGEGLVDDSQGLIDENGNIEDQFDKLFGKDDNIFGSADPNVISNFESIKASTADLISKGILKRKCY